ncbi:hypothetical protein [Methylobacterium sp. A54F]
MAIQAFVDRPTRPKRAVRGAWASLLAGGIALAGVGLASAEDRASRLFIQVWWEAQAVEMDPSDDPGRIEVYVGEVFVGCAIAPAHLNYRKQLMLVPPSLGYMASGEASAVKVQVTGHLGSLPGRQVKVTRVEGAAERPPS